MEPPRETTSLTARPQGGYCARLNVAAACQMPHADGGTRGHSGHIAPQSAPPDLASNISWTYTLRVWEISLHPEVEAWFLDLCRADPASADLVAEAIDLLSEQARPWVARWLIGSRPVGSTI